MDEEMKWQCPVSVIEELSPFHRQDNPGMADKYTDLSSTVNFCHCLLPYISSLFIFKRCMAVFPFKGHGTGLSGKEKKGARKGNSLLQNPKQKYRNLFDKLLGEIGVSDELYRISACLCAFCNIYTGMRTPDENKYKDLPLFASHNSES